MNKVIFLVVGLVLLLTGCSQEQPTKLTNIKGLIADLEFSLTDENNKQVTAKDYLGSTVALFFGFTSCPDICPITMHQFANILEEVDPAGTKVKVLFVSVDPDRDTPEKLKAYTSTFGDAFVGLMGEDSEIKSMTKRYRVTFGYGEKDTEGNYDVSHSGALFLFDNKGQARLLVTQSTPADDIAVDLRELIQK
jgi:protein SCO1/2